MLAIATTSPPAIEAPYPLIPRHDRLIVEVIDQAHHTTNIVLPPEGDEKRPRMVRVLARGPEVDESVPVGATLLIGKFAGQVLRHRGEEFLFIQDADIAAVVES